MIIIMSFIFDSAGIYIKKALIKKNIMVLLQIIIIMSKI